MADAPIGESTPLKSYFSPILRTELINFREGFLKYYLQSDNILRNSERVYRDEIVFAKNTDYQIDYDTGVITFFESMLLEEWVEVEYAIVPEEIEQQFYYFLTQDYSDTLAVDTTYQERFRLGFADTDLNISGSKTFSVSIGSDEDFNVYQSLFLRLDGELRENLRIRGQLSDSQSPLTPEGDTRELSSLDQIFIKLYGDEYEVAFGDLEIGFQDTEFINYSGKFEGIKGDWSRSNRFQGALAISKGKQSSNEFRGKDGKQGPYYVSLPNSGVNVQIIPGTEEVFLNGVLMSRGIDYTIDYASGSITFTNRHFIDSNSLIYMRFQYSDQDYRQNMYFNSSEINLFDNIILKHHLIIQNDDRNNPLQDIFSESDKLILEEAGDSPAWADGIIEVEHGEGLYEKVVEDGTEYYRYVGNEGNGNYLVYFTYVGSGKGDYSQVTPNSFEYVGENAGSWIPMRLLPSPQYKANYDVSLGWKGDFYDAAGEVIFSRFDRNTFSALESSDNDGYGMHWQMRFYPDLNRIDPDWRIYYRYLSENLHTFADIRDPELSYDFYEITEVDTVASREVGTVLSFNIEDILRPSIRYMRKLGKDSYNRNNLLLTTALRQHLFFPSVNYRYSYARQSLENSSLSQLNIRQNQVNAGYILNGFQLGGDYQYRTFRNSFHEEERGEVESGTRYRKRGMTLGTYQTRRVAGQIFLNQEFNDLLEDDWQKEREAVTMGGETYIDVADQSFRTAYSHREVTHSESGTEGKYDMAEINLNNTLLNRGINLFSNYSLKNLEFFPYARELVFVGQNAGIYDSTGVVTEDGEYDYNMVQVGDAEMSIEINADLMLNFTPRLFVKSVENENGSDDLYTLMKRWISRIQTESSFLVMENSRSNDKWDVYLLKPSFLMDEDMTIYGRNMHRQTAWIDLVSGRILSKISYQHDRVLDNRYQESNRTEMTSGELMLRFSRYLGSDFELTYENRSEQESRYDSKIISDSFFLDIRNGVISNLQIGTLLTYAEEKGDRTLGGVSYTLRSYGIRESLSYFFQRKYRLFARLEYRRNERSGSGFLSFLPDKREGDIFRWSFRLNYQINAFTSGGFEYSGNKYPLQDTVHKMKVEARAEF